MAEVLDLGRLLIQAPVSYQAIKNISVTEKQDTHGRLKLHLVLDSTQSADLSRLEQFPIEVLTLDGERVFCGVCTNYSTEQLGQYQELHIEAVTNSYLADITPKSLTFQNESKTLQSILEQVLGPYGVLLTLEQNPTVSQMIYQQNETDWAFARRIANQFGMSLFVNGKAAGFQLHVGAIPFTVHPVEALPNEVVEKDIQALRLHQQTTNPQLMAFEVERYGGPVAELNLGVGHALEKDGRTFILVSSEITASFGTLINRIQCVSQPGALPEPAQAPVSNIAGGSGNTENPQGPAPQLHSSNIISGQVLEVSGCDVKVQFDSGSGTRWIPYASPLSDCMYVMPDVGDTVFCYFENDGTFVCLGSKHVDNSRSDFSHPEEKVLTSKNRMIKFKGTELDITGSRSEMDGEGGMQLKIILSDEEGIEIASTKDVTFAAKEKIYIQGVEQEPDNPAQSQEILQGQAAQAEKFKQMEKQGADYQTAHGGQPGDATLAEAGLAALRDVGGAIWDEIASPFSTVASWFTSSGGGGSQAADNSIEFAEVEDKQIQIFGLNYCKLQVQESYLWISGTDIFGQSPVLHELGFYRGRTYERMEENTNTFMDNLLDGVQLALDIVGMVGSFFPPLNVVASVANAAISFCRGDVGGAVTNLLGCIPGGSFLGAIGKVASGTKKLKKLATVLEWFGKITDWIDNAQLVIGSRDAIASLENFFDVVFSDASEQEKWDALYDAANQMKNYVSPAMGAVTRRRGRGADDTKRTNKPEGPDTKSKNDSGGDPQIQKNAELGDSSKKKKGDRQDPDKNPKCGDPIDMVTGSQRMTNTDFIFNAS